MFYAFCWKEPEEEEQDSDKKVKTLQNIIPTFKKYSKGEKHFIIRGLGGCKVQKIEEKIKGLLQMLKSIFAWNLAQKDMREYCSPRF